MQKVGASLNKKNQLFYRLIFILSFFLSLSVSLAFSLEVRAEKLSLKQLTAALNQVKQINEAFQLSEKLTEDPSAQAKLLLAPPNQSVINDLESQFQQASNFVRGEIEEPQTKDQLLACLRLSMLESRSLAFQNHWSAWQKHFSVWFQFAADFPYEESSSAGIHLAQEIRALLLDEFEKTQKKFARDMAQQSTLRLWFFQVRAPWPVDRALIFEAKRLALPAALSLAEAAARAYQKQPYQSTEKVLRRSKTSASSAAEKLKAIWTDSDILLMKTEITRIGRLKLRLAAAEYEKTHQKAAASVQELTKEGLLPSVPIDYLTGKPLDLTSL